MANKHIHVLMIEDDPDDAVLVKDMLSEAAKGHFTVHHRQRLSEGVELLKKESFDVVLLDLSLPDEQGLATLGAVRTAAPDLPVVIMTGLDDETRAIQALQGGAEDYLVKGQDTSSSLARCIRYAIERNRLEATLESTLEWERRDWVRHQTLKDHKRYASMSKDPYFVPGKESVTHSTDARTELDEDDLVQLRDTYRRLVLRFIDPDNVRESDRRQVLRELVQRLADAGAGARDVIHLHLRAFPDFTGLVEPSDDYLDLLTESRLVVLEIMAGLLDIYRKECRAGEK